MYLELAVNRTILKTMNATWSSVVYRMSSASALGIFCLSLSGCATAGYNKSDATARSLQRASYEVQVESRALNSTLHTLSELVNSPGADLKPQFRRFSAALDSLVASSERNDKADVEITKRSAAYFQAWDKEISTMNYEAVRSKSQARRAEATTDFQKVHQRYLEAQGVMQPLLSYLEDIRKALSADLTQHGLEALKPIVGNANQNADKVQVALTKLSSELGDTGTRLSSYVFQNAARGSASASGPK
jgi:uncharacterized lipoprotein YehR (DUF1307 family)